MSEEKTIRELRTEYLAESAQEIAKNAAHDFFTRSPKYRTKAYLESDILSAVVNAMARAGVYFGRSIRTIEATNALQNHSKR